MNILTCPECSKLYGFEYPDRGYVVHRLDLSYFSEGEITKWRDNPLWEDCECAASGLEECEYKWERSEQDLEIFA